MSEEAKRKISLRLKGITRSPETRKKMSACKKGIKLTDEHRKNLSTAHIGLPGNPHTVESKEKLRQAHLGSKNHNWKGGKTDENHRIRRSGRYIEWRKAVYERDSYTCQFCGVVGGRLNADHIKPFADYIELRFELSNGRTLCVPCHTKTDTYGWRKLHSTRT